MEVRRISWPGMVASAAAEMEVGAGGRRVAGRVRGRSVMVVGR
jgi:hypothetical protein